MQDHGALEVRQQCLAQGSVRLREVPVRSRSRDAQPAVGPAFGDDVRSQDVADPVRLDERPVELTRHPRGAFHLVDGDRALDGQPHERVHREHLVVTVGGVVDLRAAIARPYEQCRLVGRSRSQDQGHPVRAHDRPQRDERPAPRHGFERSLVNRADQLTELLDRDRHCLPARGSRSPRERRLSVHWSVATVTTRCRQCSATRARSTARR